MYDELIKQLRELPHLLLVQLHGHEDIVYKAADAIEELQATLCNWCAVCPEDKRDLSTCEIYESCRAKQPKEET